MQVAIPPVSDQFRPNTANTGLGSTGSSVFGPPTPPNGAARPSTSGGHDRKFSPRSGGRLATLSGSPRSPRGDMGAIVPVPRPGHTDGVPRQVRSRGSPRGSPRRPRLPGLGLSSSSSELRWLAKVTPGTAEDLIKLHLTTRQQLNTLAAERQARQERLKALQDEFMGTQDALVVEQKVLDGDRARVSALQLKLKKCTSNQKLAQQYTFKLNVMLRRTKKEWVNGMARMQDIGQYANEQMQGLFRGSQWRMYNELLREAAAFNLTSVHAEVEDLERERETQIATRRRELDVLEELNRLLIAGREEANREREQTNQKRKEAYTKAIVDQSVQLSVAELQRITTMETKVNRALELLTRRGHRFADFDAPGRTVLDDLLDQLQHQNTLSAELSQAKKQGTDTVARLTAEVEALEKHLAIIAFPTETPEPDVDGSGVLPLLNPRALGILHDQQLQLDRELNSKKLVLPDMESRAAKVIQWFKRVTPTFELFDVFRKSFDEEATAMSPLGIDLTQANQVSCWLKSMETTLAWAKLEVKQSRAVLGRQELDWQAFETHGLAAVEDGKVLCLDTDRNLRVLTEEQEFQRQSQIRRKLIAERTKAEVAAERVGQYVGMKPTCELVPLLHDANHNFCGLSACMHPGLSSRLFWFVARAVSKAQGKVEALRAAKEGAELEQLIAEQIELEKRLDTMSKNEAIAYEQKQVRDIHDAHIQELRKAHRARQTAVKAKEERLKTIPRRGRKS